MYSIPFKFKKSSSSIDPSSPIKKPSLILADIFISVLWSFTLGSFVLFELFIGGKTETAQLFDTVGVLMDKPAQQRNAYLKGSIAGSQYPPYILVIFLHAN